MDISPPLLVIGAQEIGLVAAGVVVLMAVVWIANKIKGNAASKE